MALTKKIYRLKLSKFIKSIFLKKFENIYLRLKKIKVTILLINGEKRMIHGLLKFKEYAIYRNLII